MSSKSRNLLITAFALALVATPAVYADEDPHAHHREMMKKKSEPALEAAEIDLRNGMVLDQDGREMEFVTDAIGDHIVVMDFVYTTCTTICPVLSALFNQVQTKLGSHVVGSEVRLISMSVDPIRDTPQRLKAYSAKHRAAASSKGMMRPDGETIPSSMGSCCSIAAAMVKGLKVEPGCCPFVPE